MARGDDARSAAHENGPLQSVQSQLLREQVRRQPVLVAVNLAAAALFAWAMAGAAPVRALVTWLATLTLVQASRLLCWRRHRASRGAADPSRWLLATSAAAGLAWGMIGPLFSGLGSPAQQMLIPFFLAGMGAGAVVTLAGHPRAVAAFLVPALLPYAVSLAASGEPEALSMALTTLAYAVGLGVVAYQIQRSLRSSVELHLENARLVADLHATRLRLEEQAQRRAAELDAVLASVPVAVWLVHDPEGKRITGNRQAAQMLRLRPGDNESLSAPDEERPRHFKVLKDGRELPPAELPLQRAARGEIVRDEEVRVTFADGAFFDELISAAPVRDPSGQVVGAVGAAIDITARKRAEEEARRLALHDPLTGLPNRVLLLDRVGQALARARREAHHVAVMLIDLDGFKEVNDTLGHAAGDRLLRGVGERLAAVVRASDTLARLGGDEFALVQPGVRRRDDAAALAAKLLSTFGDPFELDGQEVQVSASLGIALLTPDDEEVEADELLRRADLALYRAKQEKRGGRRIRLFEPAMEREARARRTLERELREALDRGEFALHYQPQFDLATSRITGVEALLRWHHPERGVVAPGEFVGAAEASGLIRPLGAWVLSEACRQACAWRNEGLSLLVAVNLSPAQLRHGGVVEALDAALSKHGLDGRWLELELTEGLRTERADGAADPALLALAARGVRLALDDFGTAYSSLAHLRRLPVQRIKIDCSFVRRIGQDREDEAVVRAIVSLGHTLGKEVVAEGVETEPQLAFLRKLGCDAAQGFLLARPQAAADLGLMLVA